MEFFFHVTNTDDFKQTIDLAKTSHGHELMRAEFIDPEQNDLLPEFLQTVLVTDYILKDLPVRFFDNIGEVSRN